MRMESFRIRKFRNIQDSGEVRLDDRLTCIVGKNQSGKTALLQALHRFNPRDAIPYRIQREWPRGERRTRDEDQVVCEVAFGLEDEEKAELARLASVPVAGDRVTVTRSYRGRFECAIAEHPDLFPTRAQRGPLDQACASLPAVPADAGNAFREAAAACADEVRRLAVEGRFSGLIDLAARHDQRLRSAFSANGQPSHHQAERAFLDEYLTWLGRLPDAVEAIPARQRQAHEHIVSWMPRFIYMGQYLEFSGAADLDQLKRRRDTRSLLPQDETILMILSLAGAKLDDLVARGSGDDLDEMQERQLDLDDAARTISKAVAGRWGQRPYEIEFRIDRQMFLVSIKEEGKDAGLIPLEDQSSGFRWFFSFDLRFLHDSDGSFEGCVLLLDEPGIHLHPGAQGDLLKRLDAYAEKNTLVYTTHLPFLIDLREPRRIRIMSEARGGAAVPGALNKASHDEKLTLQAALGMRVAQNYLTAPRNLVVESAADAWIVGELSSLFERSGKPALPEEVRITPASGASDAIYLATFMIGQDLQVVTLFDSNPEGRRNEE